MPYFAHGVRPLGAFDDANSHRNLEVAKFKKRSLRDGVILALIEAAN